MTEKTYRCIGIMTGNSLDAVDVVLTEFRGQDIKDLCGHSVPIPVEISNAFRQLKFLLSQNNCDIKTLSVSRDFNFNKLHDDYIRLVADTVKEMLQQNNIPPQSIDIIGFHGQTCGHCPPSIAGTLSQVYTLQIGSGQMLADLLKIPVAFDFRSDDLMNLGEGAPLAPVHNQHLTNDLKNKNIFPVAFCNGGNTGNISVISRNKITGQETVMGWDVGPFNHFIDLLMREEKKLPCDFDGQTGKKGKINYRLLRKLFENAVRNNRQENFITLPPPKSSDPAWYHAIPELLDKDIPFEDRVRTAEFFSAYIFVYNLYFILNKLDFPKYFLLFGGGWKNPVVTNDFKNLLFGKADVLPEHADIFGELNHFMPAIEWSDIFGYNGHYMEARIFADMGKCLLTQEPFTFPETTGCRKPTIGGIIAQPGGNNPLRWSRAAPGWADESDKI